MPEAPPLRTPLHAWHQAHGGRLVEFGGWEMPVQYSAIVEEHTAVRERVGLFDIGHMGRLDFDGPDVLAWLNYATTNDVARLRPGQIQYSLMVDEAGGVLDDILVYRIADGEHGDGVNRARYQVVCNASNREKVLAHLRGCRGGRSATVVDMTFRTAMIALQGPRALDVLDRVIVEGTVVDPETLSWNGSLAALKNYHNTRISVRDAEMPPGLGMLVSASRTGYTGEDGFELIAGAENGERLWDALLAAGRGFGILPCGLGARDTLRFEAGMPLYGHEMDETVNPYAAGLGGAVKLNKGEFVGRDALRKFKGDPGMTRVGLELEGKRIARQGCPVTRGGRAVGAVTSGTFAPTLGKSLAMALVEPGAGAVGAALAVDVRGRAELARVVPLPFYRRPGAGTSPAGPSPVGA